MFRLYEFTGRKSTKVLPGCWYQPLVAAANSPGVANRVSDGSLTFRRNLHGKLNGVAVELGVVRGFLHDFPVIAAVEMLEYVNGDGLRLLVSQLDLEVLVEGAAAIVDVKIGLSARSRPTAQVEVKGLDVRFRSFRPLRWSGQRV